MQIIVETLNYGTFTSTIFPKEDVDDARENITAIIRSRGTLSFDTPENETVFLNGSILKNAVIKLRY